LLIILALLACKDSRTTDGLNRIISFKTQKVGVITDRRIAEMSGIAASRRSPGVLWVINDSGDDARVYAIDEYGTLLSSTKVNGAENLDWEDIASFEKDGKSYLLIADIGNNTVYRDIFTLYVIEEPGLGFSTSDIVWQIQFQYENGPRDTEAVAVDLLYETILLLSKRDVPAVLYELPLKPAQGVLSARRLGDVTSIPQPRRAEIKTALDYYHAQPTAMDMTPDGARLAILTYRRLFIYDLHPDKTIIESLNQKPQQFEFPTLAQPEALCFSMDQNALFTTTENVPAPLLKITVE